MSSGRERSRLLFATTSGGKLGEGRSLLAGLALDLIGLAELLPDGAPLVQVEEDAPDYAGNARLKARQWAARSGLAVLADDSGLEVDALGGRPGVESARFGGPGLDDGGRNALLLERLRDCPEASRGAVFVCVLVLVAASGEEIALARGERRGRIAPAPRGAKGFGYDPLFELEDRGGRTFAELAPEEKLRESHRGRAFRALRLRLEAVGPGLEGLLAPIQARPL